MAVSLLRATCCACGNEQAVRIGRDDDAIVPVHWAAAAARSV